MTNYGARYSKRFGYNDNYFGPAPKRRSGAFLRDLERLVVGLSVPTLLGKESGASTTTCSPGKCCGSKGTSPYDPERGDQRCGGEESPDCTSP